MMSNWMTTIPGILTLIGVMFNAWQTKTVNIHEMQDALIGIGLIAAKDWNVTGGTKSQ